MKYDKVKELIELLLTKKNSILLNKDEQQLLNELQSLLYLNYSIEINLNAIECKCEINKDTIESEIENNKCSECGLPLVAL